MRQWSTVLIYSKGGSQLPFDVAPLRAMPYTLTPEGKPAEAVLRRAFRDWSGRAVSVPQE